MSGIEDVMAAALARAKQLKEQNAVKLNMVAPSATSTAVKQEVITASGAFAWNEEQTMAIQKGLLGESYCIIGSAGTGKTTTLRGLLKQMLEEHKLPMLEAGTQYLSANTPGVVLVSYTRRAVRNIARQMPPELKPHCITIHKLLEFAPEYYDDGFNERGEVVKKMRFAPQRNEEQPLPANLRTIVIDESSMVDIELFEKLLAALPYPSRVQFIYMGDLNQLPPVYGQAILGKALLELPIVDLKRVYRQALESPIISLALAVKNNDFRGFNKDAKELWGAGAAFDVKEVKEKITLKSARGSVTLQPWKKKFEMEDALHMMNGQIAKWIDDGYYNPDEDLVLCPWNKAFGSDEMNKAIAQKLAIMRETPTWEIIAGFQKHYFAVGDKVLYDKQEAIILDIYKNPKYLGKAPAKPSTKLSRWGGGAETDMESMSNQDIDALLEALGEVEDRKAECSHTLKLRLLDNDEEVLVSKSAEVNSMSFAYVISVHKSQGSECRKVFMITHYCHAKMLFRELVYTGVTRAAEELHVIMSPMMLSTAASRPRIKGDTLEAKLEFYRGKLGERLE